MPPSAAWVVVAPRLHRPGPHQRALPHSCPCLAPRMDGRHRSAPPLPRFAPFTFREWWSDRSPSLEDGRPRVILWPDTWGNHFEPEILIAAVNVLESAGFAVVVPRRPLCCGRPLYDYGMLDLARKLLREILEELRPALRAGIPIVGLEPSCISVFREELPQFFPDDPDATRLRQGSHLLSSFLLRHAEGWQAPRLEGEAVVHGHCHHRSVLNFDRDASLYSRMGLKAAILDSGCCGMAGAFGYEKGKYAVSLACAERMLAPAVRQAGEATWVVADGFSCRSQIEQLTGRRAVHTAELVWAAMRGGKPLRANELPLPRRRKRTNALLALTGLGALYLYTRGRRA